jgi:hypothetical protein
MKVILLKILIILCLVSISFGVSGIGPDFTRPPEVPPRIIRTCCAFGKDVGLVGLPFVKMNDVIDVADIGQHQYLGGKNEGNGIVYTRRGGFIDLGHLRDLADWTAYLHSLIMDNRGTAIDVVLGKEGGIKKLRIEAPANFSYHDAALLAGRIAYDLSVWHEIATWYGASSVPFVPERYSSFSIEDDYSNQLGILCGVKAILSDEPYNDAMTQIIRHTIDSLGVVSSIEETLQAMELVNGRWWWNEYRYPNKYFLLEHCISNYETTYPLLVPEMSEREHPVPVKIGTTTLQNQLLTEFYMLELKLNNKIPFEKIFHDKKRKKVISNHDFVILLEHIRHETQLLPYRKFKRKTARQLLE